MLKALPVNEHIIFGIYTDDCSPSEPMEIPILSIGASDDPFGINREEEPEFDEFGWWEITDPTIPPPC